MATKAIQPHIVIPIKNKSREYAKLLQMYAQMNEGQRGAFKTAVEHFNSYYEEPAPSINQPYGFRPVGEPLRMFLTGEGGTGKSHLIKAIMLFAQLKWGKTEGHYGPVVAVAPTGNAAHNISGHTWQSLLGKVDGYLEHGKDPPQPLVNRLFKKLNGLRVLVIDEVSMIALQDLYDIHMRCHAARGMACWNKANHEASLPFANLHVIIAGDLYQLPPVFGEAVYHVDRAARDRVVDPSQQQWHERAVLGVYNLCNMSFHYNESTEMTKVYMRQLFSHVFWG